MTFVNERLLTLPATSAVDPNYMHASGALCAAGVCVQGAVSVPSTQARAFRAGAVWGAVGALGLVAVVAIARSEAQQ